MPHFIEMPRVCLRGELKPAHTDRAGQGSGIPTQHSKTNPPQDCSIKNTTGVLFHPNVRKEVMHREKTKMTLSSIRLQHYYWRKNGVDRGLEAGTEWSKTSCIGFPFFCLALVFVFFRGGMFLSGQC